MFPQSNLVAGSARTKTEWFFSQCRAIELFQVITENTLVPFSSSFLGINIFLGRVRKHAKEQNVRLVTKMFCTPSHLITPVVYTPSFPDLFHGRETINTLIVRIYLLNSPGKPGSRKWEQLSIPCCVMPEE